MGLYRTIQPILEMLATGFCCLFAQCAHQIVASLIVSITSKSVRSLNLNQRCILNGRC